jgi:hypothetical protein
MVSPREVVDKLSVKSLESRREVYLHKLDQVAELSLSKYLHKQTKNTERIRWGRLMVQAVQAGASIVKDIDLDAINERLLKIEANLR